MQRYEIEVHNLKTHTLKSCLLIVLNDDTNKITKIVPIIHSFFVFCILFILHRMIKSEDLRLIIFSCYGFQNGKTSLQV